MAASRDARFHEGRCQEGSEEKHDPDVSKSRLEHQKQPQIHQNELQYAENHHSTVLNHKSMLFETGIIQIYVETSDMISHWKQLMKEDKEKDRGATLSK